MSDNTKIEWTDATVNAVNGCSVVSPGCKHCYAMKQAHRFPVRQGLTMKSAGGMVWTGEVRFNEKALLEPLGWTRPRRIFWNAHGDLFHESVPDEWIDKVFAVCALTPQHQHQILTKRPARMRQYMESIDNADGERLEGFRSALVEGMAQSIWHARTGDDSVDEWLAVHLPLPNVWLGVSVEDQQRADERIPDLLATPAAVRFLSCEPLLGPVDLQSVCNGHYFQNPLTGDRWHEPPEGFRGASDREGTRICWVIVGGESGPGARPMHPDWARSLRDQCAAAGVPFFFKQWGDWVDYRQLGAVGWRNVTPQRTSYQGPPRGVLYGAKGGKEGPFDTRFDLGGPNGPIVVRVGKKAAGRLLDGVQHDGMPG
jgi:protein gp37